MSYCVQCGVELSADRSSCPLCETPVLNPNEQKVTSVKPDFPQNKGVVESADRRDLGILLTTFVVATSLTCGLLNLWAFPSSPWSLVVIGLCIVLWVITIPLLFRKNQSIYFSLILDGLAVALYLYMISFMTKDQVWLKELGLPLVILILLVILGFTLAKRRSPKSFLWGAFCFFTTIAILCIGIEFLIDRYLTRDAGLLGRLSLGWSAIVLTVCVVLDVTVVTLLSRRRLRSEVRRRFHF
jgi:hypothetical protein